MNSGSEEYEAMSRRYDRYEDKLIKELRHSGMTENKIEKFLSPLDKEKNVKD